MKNILLLTTGGTIASGGDADGLRPQLCGELLLEAVPSLRRSYNITALDLLNLDSSNIQPEEWQKIARAAFRALPDYDGVVITHGTDTMAYTASMLSYMLRDITKPVILTGSQLPVDRLLSDAPANLTLAFTAAASSLRGVGVAFDHRVIRGCRAVKVRTLGFDAFESVNAPPLAEADADGFHILPGAELPPPTGEPALLDRLSTDVFLLKLIPGTDPSIFARLAEGGMRGLVLETFGAGGLHFMRRNLLPRLRELTDSGVSVAACSQCLYETSDFSIYEVGRRLLDCGVIPGRDMTSEALVTKMMWALGQTDDPGEIRRIFQTNYAGEVSV